MNRTGEVVLSILVPSIPSRESKLLVLKKELQRQCNIVYMRQEMLGNIEILVDKGAAFLDGGLSIGKKRQALVKNCIGEYLCFLDDDESIAPNYVESLLRLCNTGNDIGTFRALVKLKESWGLVNMSLNNKENEQFNPDHTVQRPPWHMCPVKSKYAKLYEFDDINNAEDFRWFEKVLSHCKTEEHTDRIIFQYNHGDHSEADRIENLKT